VGWCTVEGTATTTVACLVSTGRLLVSGTKTRQMQAGSLPAQSPSRGSGDRRAVYDYKNVRNTYQITINVDNGLHPLAHTPDTAVQGL
jgi:hypothetical protein